MNFISFSGPPEVYLLTKKSGTSSKRLILTCLATGFYPPDVQMQVRKSRTSLPEHLVTSSGVNPNGDGTYQLRMSVEILKDELTMYECYVTHSALDYPLIEPKRKFSTLSELTAHSNKKNSSAKKEK